MTKRVGELDVSVSNVELDNQVSAGISWHSLGSDMVPIFEEHAARLERNYTLEQWYGLHRMERAIIIAQRRLDNAMKAHQNEAEAKKMKRESAHARKR